ncbi:methyltransferase domain-containing protein [Helicobacter sp. MIT 21-1697]|uniref:class I SAM-dependent methyltransferase n=1 Tax=Helicobacter sp. MIT 21-1697 TaxID=2993733 RepID=UPI00224B94A7|nr:methyltransferase domain-containing protein [Helicobacter sp. MIT 21-1697]MCX2716262.1 methyltransferase domain-containing protein [Helicobacter sp. MIT 21-1697]
MALNLSKQWGGGYNIINADFFSHFKPYKTYSLPMPQWQLDLRYPLRCPSHTFDGVFSEHTLEHLYIDDAIALLREVFRILKPNGTIRLSVPDLGFHIEQYLRAKEDSVAKPLACEYIRKLTQEYLHLSVWDYDRLAYTLEAVGFVDIERSSFGNGRDTLLLFDAKERAFESLYIEASKPNKAL